MNAENLTHKEVLNAATKGYLEIRNFLFGNTWCNLVPSSTLPTTKFSVIPAYIDSVVFGEVVGSQSSEDRLYLWSTHDYSYERYFYISDLRLKTLQSNNIADNLCHLYMDSEHNIFLRTKASPANCYTDRKIFIGYVVQEPPTGFCTVTYFKNLAVPLDCLTMFVKQEIAKNVLVVEGLRLKWCYTELNIDAEPTTMKFVEFDGQTLALFIGQEHERKDVRGGATLCQSYAHVGQHGNASTTLKKCKASTASQYTSLLRELASLGYLVNVVNTK